MAKIGIMGGTFNPIHNVHLIMAEEARRQFGLKKVWFMPSGRPPHKTKEDIVSDEHRKRMIQHAIRENEAFALSELELERDGITYTKDTLEYLRNEYPKDSFYFIVGGDSLAQMESWREPEFVFANCHVLAGNRDESDNGKIHEWISYYQKKYDAHISEIKMPSITISSQMIREKLSDGKSIADYCPVSVEYYIRLNLLYGITETGLSNPPSDDELIRCLSSVLKPKRFIHTLGVAVTAANLAQIHGCNSRRAYRAGLLHDCAKYLTDREQVALCKETGIYLRKIEQENPALIHGKLSAFFANTRYQVEDDDILSAITWHTTGRPDMTLLEKIIYLADYIEPGRVMECQPTSLQELRKMSFCSLDDAVLAVLENGVHYLNSSDKPIDDMTIKTFEFYQNRCL